jgi:hypothetical protein
VKRALIIGVFVFSLVLNAATLATLGWHLWAEKRFAATAPTVDAPLGRKDLKDIYRLWPNSVRANMRELKMQIRAKRVEMLDTIAANPGNPQAAEKSMREFSALRDQMERQALVTLSEVLANLPPEKRDALVAHLKSRTRLGPGMGPDMGLGHGRHFRRRHLKEDPPLQGPESAEPPAAPRNQP